MTHPHQPTDHSELYRGSELPDDWLFAGSEGDLRQVIGYGFPASVAGGVLLLHSLVQRTGHIHLHAGRHCTVYVAYLRGDESKLGFYHVRKRYDELEGDWLVGFAKGVGSLDTDVEGRRVDHEACAGFLRLIVQM